MGKDARRPGAVKTPSRPIERQGQVRLSQLLHLVIFHPVSEGDAQCADK